jgi:hypothetical protein
MNYRTCFVAMLAIRTAVSVNGAVLTVTSLADSGPGSLRDQVAASAPGDTIRFNVTGTIVLISSITIAQTLFVQGPGPANLTVDANFVDRAFIVTGGVPAVFSGMTIRDGLIVGVNGVDGGFNMNGTDGLQAYGGAVLLNNPAVNGNLILSNCWFNRNTVIGGRGGRGGDNTPFADYPPGNGGDGGYAAGGVVYSFIGNVTAVNCTFSGNRAIGGRGGNGGNNQSEIQAGGTGGKGGGGKSGALDVVNSIAPGFTNCTFSGNFATGGFGGQGGTNNLPLPGGNGGDANGGICGAMQAFAFSMVSCTVVSNTANGGTGGAGGSGTPVGSNGNSGGGIIGGIGAYSIACAQNLVGNTILADNFANTFSNGDFGYIDLGFNYFGDNVYLPCAGVFSRIGTVIAPLHSQLGPLAQNGSGLPTHAPLPGSPVIDWGFSFGTTADERGAPRPFGVPVAGSGGDGSDIGAFEFGSTPLGLGVVSNNVVVSWPAYYGDFTLQFATSLAGLNNWAVVTNPPVVVGNQFMVTNGLGGASGFFRLIGY